MLRLNYEELFRGCERASFWRGSLCCCSLVGNKTIAVSIFMFRIDGSRCSSKILLLYDFEFAKHYAHAILLMA